MNYTQKIQKLKQNSKALSPVVASIILIAVTVAVSIAVAAWMGGLAGGFMQTEQITVTNVQFTGTTADDKAIVVSVSNTGTSAVTISTATINGVTNNPASAVPVDENGVGTVSLSYEWESGDNYQIKLVSNKGNSFTYTAVAP